MGQTISYQLFFVDEAVDAQDFIFLVENVTSGLSSPRVSSGAVTLTRMQALSNFLICPS
jgi:hypothetical protein